MKNNNDKEDNLLLVEHKRWQVEHEQRTRHWQANHDQRTKHDNHQLIFWACVVVVASLSAGAALMNVITKM